MTAEPPPAGPAAARPGTAARALGQDEPREPENAQAAPGSRPSGIGRQVLTLGLDLVAPILVYYGLRWAGAGNLVALGAGATLPAAGAAIKVVRERKLDQLAVIVMITMLVSIAISFLTGSTQFLLSKDGWLTGVWGLWFLLSVRADRPAAFLFSRPLLEGRAAFTAGSWDTLWQEVPAFRRIWKASTVMWGLGLLVDAGVRVAIAYTLPLAVVPALGGALYPATFVVLQVVTNVYYYRSGLWSVLGASWVQPGRRPPL
jgi:hypothetical protein